jgi:hypothetical protein
VTHTGLIGRFSGAAAVIALATAVLAARELKPATLATYDRYIALTEQRIAQENDGTRPFLWIDQQPASAREALMARLRNGEVVVERAETRDQGKPISVNGGLIHHWVGTVLLPNVPVDRAVAFVQDYDRYQQLFDPIMPRVRVLEHDGDRYVVAMRTAFTKVVTVVMDGDYVITYHRLGPSRVWTTTIATNLFQIHDADTPNERREPGDAASGFLWRYSMYCKFEQRADGSLDQCEAVTLTRDVPFAIAWLVRPFITGIPRDEMTFTLGRVRAALVRQAGTGPA